MHKTYKRNPMNSIFWIAIGILLTLSSFRDGQFVPLYDGLRILVGLVAIFFGVWGFITPIVTMTDTELFVKISIDKKRKFELSNTKIEIGEENTYIDFSDDSKSITLKLKELSKAEKERLLEDVKKMI